MTARSDAAAGRVTWGKTDVEVPRVSVGTWGHGGAKSVRGRPVGWSGADDDASVNALRVAAERGVLHWDTADVYGEGHAERLVGSLWTEIPRERVVLATKVGWAPGRYGHPYDPRQVQERFEQSLRNLQTDYVDVYYFHHCNFGEDGGPLDEALELFHRWRDAGKVRWVGLSDWSCDAILRWAPRIEPDVVQLYRNVLDDTYASSGLQEWVEANQVGAAFFSPLRHGLLLGRHRRPPEFGSGDHRERIAAFQDQRLLDHLQHCRREVERRFADRPQPVLSALLGVLLEDSQNACALLGVRRPEHANALAEIEPIDSPEDAEWVRSLYRNYALDTPS